MRAVVGASVLHDLLGDLQRLGLVLAHEGDGLEPAGEEGRSASGLPAIALSVAKITWTWKSFTQVAEQQQRPCRRPSARS